MHTAGPQYKDVEQTVDVEDDPQTKFYKRHMKKTETPHASGRTPIYDFDEWNSQHYGKSFARSQEARKRFNDKPVRELRESNSLKYEILILGGMSFVTGFLVLISNFGSPDPDAPIISTKAT